MDRTLQLLKKAAAIDPSAKDAYIAALERALGLGDPIDDFPEYIKTLLENTMQAIWIVDEDGDPGLHLQNLGVCINYYKWHDTFVVRQADSFEWRRANKRELSRGVMYEQVQ